MVTLNFEQICLLEGKWQTNDQTAPLGTVEVLSGSTRFTLASICLKTMEGDLSKKSIHINESFVHAIYIGIVVNSYSDIVAYI